MIRIYNQSPFPGDVDVLLSITISFDIDSPTSPIDISTLNVEVSDPAGTLISAVKDGVVQSGFIGSFVPDGTVYHIQLAPQYQFSYAQVVQVGIEVENDASEKAQDSYSFTTVPNPQVQRVIESTTFDVDLIQDAITGKFDLRTDSVGQLQTARGRNKLVNQLLHAAISTANRLQFISAQTITEMRSVLIEILRQFRANQIEFEFENDETLQGFNIYRLNPETQLFELINPVVARTLYVDTNVSNGFEYSYQIVPVFTDVFDRVAIKSVVVSPSAYTRAQKVIIFPQFVIRPGNNQIEFYFALNRRFTVNELLETVGYVEVGQSAEDPRLLIINIQVQTLGGQPALVDRAFTLVS